MEITTAEMIIPLMEVIGQRVLTAVTVKSKVKIPLVSDLTLNDL